MKRPLVAVPALCNSATAFGALGADVGVFVPIRPPGACGRVDIGPFARPQLS